MEDENFSPEVGEKTETALKLLDLAFHQNTGDIEALSAIRAFRKITKGALPSILCGNYYGEGGDIIREDEWQEIFSKQEIELATLRGEVRRLKKALDEAKRRTRRASGEAPAHQEKVNTPPPELSIRDEVWASIQHLVPAKYRNERGRTRVAAMIVITRTGCGWRVLATPEKPDGWTTFYNQYNQKWRHEKWWADIMEIIDGLAEPQEA